MYNRGLGFLAFLNILIGGCTFYMHPFYMHSCLSIPIKTTYQNRKVCLIHLSSNINILEKDLKILFKKENYYGQLCGTAKEELVTVRNWVRLSQGSLCKENCNAISCKHFQSNRELGEGENFTPPLSLLTVTINKTQKASVLFKQLHYHNSSRYSSHQ